jgi:hypothetical protein
MHLNKKGSDIGRSDESDATRNAVKLPKNTNQNTGKNKAKNKVNEEDKRIMAQ